MTSTRKSLLAISYVHNSGLECKDTSSVSTLTETLVNAISNTLYCTNRTEFTYGKQEGFWFPE